MHSRSLARPVALLAAFLVALTAGPALAASDPSAQASQPSAGPSASPSESAHPPARHHHGFFLRMDGGFGYFNASLSSDTELGLKGPLASLGISVGASLSAHWALAGRLWFMGAPKPTVQSGSLRYQSEDSSVGLGALGPQLTYYFMPSNFYLSGALGLSTLSMTVNGTQGTTQVGVAGQFSVGKEWWVGETWGLGIAGELSASANRDSDQTSSPTWGAWTGALVFTATYN